MALSRRRFTALGGAALLGATFPDGPASAAEPYDFQEIAMPIEPPREVMLAHLRRANEVAGAALRAGRHPFGAVLVAPDQQVVMEQGNEGTVRHAESVLAQRAAEAYSAEALWDYTLYTTVESCAMCAGTQYWANIGTLVYGISERMLLSLTGNHAENPTLDVPSRYVFEHGQKAVRVYGPFDEVAEEIVALHRGFW